MIVQYDGFAAVGKEADEIAEILREKRIGDDDVLDLDRLDRERKHIS